MSATRGTRMLQTFGSWYGFKFPDKVNDWSHLECDCGGNDFVREGVLFRIGVFMSESGRWTPRPAIVSRGSP
ncbi:MAG TPA: hypothetical protein VKW06_10590 [Candidatus Angelobacter sp.]|nr:hypothetical protein [Candidatus Angelobacter sp.]